MLELYAVKVARTVLKGESGGNAADLLGKAREDLQEPLRQKWH